MYDPKSNTFPDEIAPLSCEPRKSRFVDKKDSGGISASAYDVLDTLFVLGDFENIEFMTEKLCARSLHFKGHVSLFETNIRVLGGMLSAHLLMQEFSNITNSFYNDCYLFQANELGHRLLPAFDTPTGMPYGAIDLNKGVRKKETPVTNTASIGTLIVEFGVLSHLTGNPIFYEKAKKAVTELHSRRTRVGLVCSHMNIRTGEWEYHDTSLGATVDSYYEYLLKGYMLFGDLDLLDMFEQSKKVIDKYLVFKGFNVRVDCRTGYIQNMAYDSLSNFYPAVLSLYGSNITHVYEQLHAIHLIQRRLPYFPERFSWSAGTAENGGTTWPLRPEIVESVWYASQVINDDYFDAIAVDVLESLKRTRCPCGFCEVRDARRAVSKKDRQESFLLSETFKYLLLMFSDDLTQRFGTHKYLYSTEAHMFPLDGRFNTKHPDFRGTNAICARINRFYRLFNRPPVLYPNG
ncbi:hypothetical protein PCE1_000432 [Barthelona sp. PCE]